MITVYGSETCEETERSRALLDREGIPYRYVDVDHDPDAERAAAGLDGGHLKTPTIVFEGSGVVLIEPADESLVLALKKQGMLLR